MRLIEISLGIVGSGLVVYAMLGFGYRELAEAQILAKARSQNTHASVREPDETVPAAQSKFKGWSRSRIRLYEAMSGHLPQAEAILNIPSIELTAPVLTGASDANLNVSAARIESTAAFGESGNIGIAAHRDSFFRRLGELEVGDIIELKVDGQTWIYKTKAHFVVNPDDIYVLNPTEQNLITLVTCYPFYYVGSAPERYIVQGKLVSKPT